MLVIHFRQSRGWSPFSRARDVLLAISAYRCCGNLLWRLRIASSLLCLHRSDSVFLLVVISLSRFIFSPAVCQLRCDFDITTHLRAWSPRTGYRAPSIHSHFGGEKLNAELVGEFRSCRPEWDAAAVCLAWQPAAAVLFRSEGAAAFSAPAFVKDGFREIVRDHGALYLRTAT